MRTPGHDFELAAGWLRARGPRRPRRRSTRSPTAPTSTLTPEQEFNVVTVTLDEPPAGRPRPPAHRGHAPGRPPAGSAARTASTRCSTCRAPPPWPATPIAGGPGPVAARTCSAPPSRSSTAPAACTARPWSHAAGEVLVVREDIGRHNAVDKVTGARVLAGQSPAAACLVVSGRAGFELAQKAVAAGVGALVAVGAPSSLTVRLAQETGLRSTASPRARAVCELHLPDRRAPAFVSRRRCPQRWRGTERHRQETAACSPSPRTPARSSRTSRSRSRTPAGSASPARLGDQPAFEVAPARRGRARRRDRRAGRRDRLPRRERLAAARRQGARRRRRPGRAACSSPSWSRAEAIARPDGRTSGRRTGRRRRGSAVLSAARPTVAPCASSTPPTGTSGGPSTGRACSSTRRRTSTTCSTSSSASASTSWSSPVTSTTGRCRPSTRSTWPTRRSPGWPRRGPAWSSPAATTTPPSGSGFGSRLIDAAGVHIRTDARTVGTPVLARRRPRPGRGLRPPLPRPRRAPRAVGAARPLPRGRADRGDAPGPRRPRPAAARAPARSCSRTPSSPAPSPATPSATSASAGSRSCPPRSSTASTTPRSATSTAGPP